MMKILSLTLKKYVVLCNNWFISTSFDKLLYRCFRKITMVLNTLRPNSQNQEKLSHLKPVKH